MCAVPNMAVFCSSLTSWFPDMFLPYLLNDFEMVPVAPVITSITFGFTLLARVGLCPAYNIILEIPISVPGLSCGIDGTGVRGGVLHVFWFFTGGSAILPSLWTSGAGINFTSALVPSKLPWNEQVLERRVEFICRHWFSNYRRFMNIHPNAVDVGFTTGSYCWLCFIHLCLSASVSFRYLSWYVLAYKYVVQQDVWLETSTQQTIINIQCVLLPIQQLVLDSKKSIWVTPWSGVLEKLVKRFVTPHGKRRFITGFTKPR